MCTPTGPMGVLIVTPYCAAVVFLLPDLIDCVCVGRAVMLCLRMMVKGRSGVKQRCFGYSSGGVHRTLSAKLEKRRGDVASPVATTLPSAKIRARRFRQA